MRVAQSTNLVDVDIEFGDLIDLIWETLSKAALHLLEIHLIKFGSVGWIEKYGWCLVYRLKVLPNFYHSLGSDFFRRRRILSLRQGQVVQVRHLIVFRRHFLAQVLVYYNFLRFLNFKCTSGTKRFLDNYNSIMHLVVLVEFGVQMGNVKPSRTWVEANVVCENLRSLVVNSFCSKIFGVFSCLGWLLFYN